MAKKTPPEGFTHADKQIMLRRSYGICELCNKTTAGHFHHRKPRRMGGVSGDSIRDVNRPSNGLALCGKCHDTVERRRGWAMDSGLLLKGGQDSAETPALLPRYRGWVLLDDEGNVEWQRQR